MADLTAKLILYRVNETLSHLAERVESFFCGPDGSPDVLSMFFIGWILLGILVYFLGSFIARRLDRLKSRTPAIPTTEPVSEKVIVPVESSNTHVKPPSSGGSSTSAPQPSSARPKGTRRAVPASSDEEDVLAPVPMSFAGRALPVADGPDSHSAKWANQVLGYLFSEPGAKNPNLTESWLLALNQQTLKAAPQHGLLVEFNSVSTNMLNLREVMVSPETGNNVTVHCRGLAEGLTFMVTATRNTGQARATQDFEVYMDRLDGKLKTLCNTEDSLLVVRFLEKPDTMVNIKAHGTPQNWALPNQQHVEDLIHEIVLQALTSSTVDLPYDREPAFPKYQKPKPPPPRPPPAAVANSHVAGDAHHHVPQQQQKLGESASPLSGAAQHQQRLLVKIIKADNLAQDKPCAEPYCVVEMDDPAQRFQTSALPNTHSPFWGEHFLFSLKNSSAELLFEIFDRGKGNQFLGLGIVSVDELQKNPSQRQVLKLRPRPTHLKEIVTGTLTVEFLFMEGSEVPVKGLVEKNSRLTKTGALITTTTIQKPQEDDSGSLANDSLADAALQELERNAGVGKQTSKSTLIIHSVQRELVRPTIQVKMDRDGKWHEVAQTNGESPSAGTAGPSTEGQGPEGISPYGTMNSDDLNRSRTKDRKSSLMGALRKRLSFKKNRSKSMDQRSAGDRPEMIDGQEEISGRSISADRSSRNKDTPSGPHHLNVTGARLDAGSTRSSLSEGSGFSGASSRTYINENSTLVIELNENGLTKHYLIPYSLAARSKWRKRGGLKLHIYNDHTFVAKHIPGSEQCQVCQRKFSRRPGKQGYGCRDCGLQCHKTCHVKVEPRCPNSTIQSLEMEYVQDPRARPKPLPS